jgi:hypothetical protein
MRMLHTGPTKFQQKDVKRNRGFRNINLWVKEFQDSFTNRKKRRVPFASWGIVNPLFRGIGEERMRKEASRRRKWWKERSGVDVRLEWLQDAETTDEYDPFAVHDDGASDMGSSDYDDVTGGGAWFGDEDMDNDRTNPKSRIQTLESKWESYEQRCRRLLVR